MPLYPHQEEAIQKGLPILRAHKIVMLAMEVRTGKTLASMDLGNRYGATSVLFITKKKAIPSIESDYEQLEEVTGAPTGFSLEVINYASIHKVNGNYDLVIIDECHSLGAFPKPGVRCKIVKEVCQGLPIIYLSGTPSPESYSQLYHQLWVSSFSPWRQYTNFYKWAKDYVKVYKMKIRGQYRNMYDRAIKSKIDQDLHHLIVSVSQKDAGFQSEVTEHFLTIPTPSMIGKMMEELQEEGITWYRHYQIPCNGGGDLINKLSQLAGGTLIPTAPGEGRRDDGLVISNFKAKYIKANFPGKKLAIFYRFRAEKGLIIEQFPNYTESPEEFNAHPNKTFVCQIQSAREGVDLQTADALVMYNIDFSATSYFQGRARLQSRDRSDETPMYWIFTDTGFERRVYGALKRKKNFTWSYYKKEVKKRKKRPQAKGQLSMDEMLNLANKL